MEQLAPGTIVSLTKEGAETVFREWGYKVSFDYYHYPIPEHEIVATLDHEKECK